MDPKNKTSDGFLVVPGSSNSILASSSLVGSVLQPLQRALALIRREAYAEAADRLSEAEQLLEFGASCGGQI